jgi:hypothetical protein
MYLGMIFWVAVVYGMVVDWVFMDKSVELLGITLANTSYLFKTHHDYF